MIRTDERGLTPVGPSANAVARDPAALYRSELHSRQRELDDVRAELAICGRSEVERFKQREAHLLGLILRLRADVEELSA